MKKWKWSAMLLLLAVGACVKEADFNAYKTEMAAWKTSVQASGTGVDTWIAQAQGVIAWVSANGAKFTCNPACSDPPAAPTPIPDGQW